jgi:hypothetical protein
LSAVPRRRDGEACGELVAPLPLHPAAGRPILELGEVGRNAAHIGRAAEDDGIGAIQFGRAGLGFGDRDKAHPCARNALRTGRNGLRKGLGMAVARMIDDGNIAHDDFQSSDLTDENAKAFLQISYFHKVTGNIWDAVYIFASRYRIVT